MRVAQKIDESESPLGNAEPITAAEMRKIEQDAIASGRVTGLELMERAGQGVVEAIFEEWPELATGDRRAVVLCGPGNNGGDGFVVARLLKAKGWDVAVFFFGSAEKLPPDARINYDLWTKQGDVQAFAHAVPWFRWPRFDADNPDVDIVVDAVFGIGLSRSIPPDVSTVADYLNDREEPDEGWIVSIDVPSGLDADTGEIVGEFETVFYADLTVTFHGTKTGHLMQNGPEACGKLVVKDIGL